MFSVHFLKVLQNVLIVQSDTFMKGMACKYLLVQMYTWPHFAVKLDDLPRNITEIYLVNIPDP